MRERWDCQDNDIRLGCHTGVIGDICRPRVPLVDVGSFDGELKIIIAQGRFPPRSFIGEEGHTNGTEPFGQKRCDNLGCVAASTYKDSNVSHLIFHLVRHAKKDLLCEIINTLIEEWLFSLGFTIPTLRAPAAVHHSRMDNHSRVAKADAEVVWPLDDEG